MKIKMLRAYCQKYNTMIRERDDHVITIEKLSFDYQIGIYQKEDMDEARHITNFFIPVAEFNEKMAVVDA